MGAKRKRKSPSDKKAKERELKERRTIELDDDVVETHTEDGRILRGNGTQLDHLLPKQTYHSLWESPEAFARYIATKASGGWHRDAGTQKESKDGDWSGTKDLDTALKLVQDGWREGAEKIEALRSYIQASNPKRPKLIKHGIVGAVPNVPRAVAGDINNMRIPDQGKSHKKPVITLMANMSANCGIDAEMISNRAAVIAALVDEIEGAGYSCEVLATAMSRGGGWDWRSGGRKDTDFKAATTVIIKPSHQPVDLMKLAFGVGHAAMFRRLIFRDWATEPTCENGLGFGLGNAGCGFKDEEEEMLEKAIYLLPSAETHSNFFKDDKTSMEVGLPWLMQFLKEKGCPPFKHVPEWSHPDLKKEEPDVEEPEDEGDEDDF